MTWSSSWRLVRYHDHDYLPAACSSPSPKVMPLDRTTLNTPRWRALACCCRWRSSRSDTKAWHRVFGVRVCHRDGAVITFSRGGFLGLIGICAVLLWIGAGRGVTCWRGAVAAGFRGCDAEGYGERCSRSSLLADPTNSARTQEILHAGRPRASHTSDPGVAWQTSLNNGDERSHTTLHRE